MSGPGAEMPFLEHLEELRVRLVRVVVALLAGFGVGLFVVQRFQVVTLLKQPIAPFLTVTGGKLVVTSPTEAVMITLKMALIVGLVLASPLIVYQVWAFLSPALYAREKKAVLPAVLVGLLLFVAGGAFAYFAILPQALPILFSFQSEGLENLITFKEYFSFVVQLVLAMGLCFEIPLVIIMLTALGVTTPAGLNRFRRYAVVLAALAGAVLSPGTDVLSMLIMTVPILLLYEVGFLGSWVIHQRRLRRRGDVGGAAAARLRAPGRRPSPRRSRPGPSRRSRSPPSTPRPAGPPRRASPVTRPRRTPPGPGRARRWIPRRPAGWGCPRRRAMPSHPMTRS